MNKILNINSTKDLKTWTLIQSLVISIICGALLMFGKDNMALITFLSWLGVTLPQVIILYYGIKN